MAESRAMKIFHIEQDGCVDHYIVAPEEGVARAIMVGQCMNMGGRSGCDPQDIESVWEVRERDRSEFEQLVWWDDETGTRRPALEILDDNDGPAYVACSEY